MKRIFLLLLLASFINSMPAFAAQDNAYRSKYIGQESRTIKSLSHKDMQELERGAGWGLAKAAELNGVPGPKHLLEMKDEIGLSQEQAEKIEAVYEKMQKRAAQLGQELIEREQLLNDRFADGTMDDAMLREVLAGISETLRELRYTHLAAHLETPKIISREQIARYNELRGYGSADPCASIPPGHNPAMWRKHNGCE